MAMALNGVGHPKLAQWSNAILVISPEHYRIFDDAGWGRTEIEEAIHAASVRPVKTLCKARRASVRIDPSLVNDSLPKFWRDHGLLIVRAGGDAGLFSAIIGGWIGGRNREVVKPVTYAIR